MTDPLWRAEDAAAATGGRLTGGPWVANGVSIDTREIKADDLFVALKDQRDGHEFVASAFGNGASAALVERESGAGPELVVDDTLQALRNLGAAARERSDARRVAVTGSVGKTSVKEALAAVFAKAGRAHASARSFNNHWGAPLTLARMPADTRRAVFELGMNHAGELTDLSGLVKPHIAAITRIGEAHIGFFKSIEAIADAKAEIFSGLEADGVAVINADDPQSGRLRAAAGDRRIVTFGRAADADARILDYSSGDTGGEGEIAVFGETVKFQIPIPGAHWAENAACVFACAAMADIDARTTAAALSAFQAPAGRGGVIQASADGKSFTLIDDSYNANPVSMRAALAALGGRQPEGEGRRIAVLGEMLELGDDAADYHARLAGPIAAAGVDLVFVSGELMGALWDALPASARGGRYASGGEVSDALRGAIRPGDVVLVKGSNASGMSRVAAALKGG
ncbi:UDP-N-acetylmuramoyl-tripeptide--D-alanyl-D-alanine ligase [Euryhalocaulis caribicus]|uniref:UDP-N-acetylmuramoyl-tripeptide--D-alanyl-D- alanine ligase n=1 Tax=Euryhalocaulis caribicus TaxID=1161401 RepID=UPI0003A4B457|nr:UDP-N-acetylmuramoyl-tripeptide--D-alanyl-D-alanine ligase [Euryhalocaulis caribicus]